MLCGLEKPQGNANYSPGRKKTGRNVFSVTVNFAELNAGCHLYYPANLSGSGSCCTKPYRIVMSITTETNTFCFSMLLNLSSFLLPVLPAKNYFLEQKRSTRQFILAGKKRTREGLLLSTRSFIILMLISKKL